MEHGTIISNIPSHTEILKNYNYIKHVGYEQNINAIYPCTKQFFSHQNINLISKKVSQLTMGVHPDNKTIVVPEEWILDVMNSVYENWSGGEVGAIHSRLIVPNVKPENSIDAWNNQTINLLVAHIRDTYGMIECNQKLTLWTTVLGEFNQHGLRSHGDIKIKNKRPESAQFNMNY